MAPSAKLVISEFAISELDWDYLESWDDEYFFDYFHDMNDVQFGSDEDDYQSLAHDFSLGRAAALSLGCLLVGLWCFSLLTDVFQY